MSHPPTAPSPAKHASSGRGVGPLAAELRHAIMRTSRRIRQERSLDDLSPGQHAVLSMLDVHGPMTPRELAAHERVQPPSMTRTVTALEEAGMVSRTDHPTDGRQVLVGLTPAGDVVVRETRQRRDAWLARRLADLDPDERDTMARAAAILARMASA
jgi:DNA-binding MarR family transcriptional regulator